MSSVSAHGTVDTAGLCASDRAADTSLDVDGLSSCSGWAAVHVVTQYPPASGLRFLQHLVRSDLSVYPWTPIY